MAAYITRTITLFTLALAASICSVAKAQLSHSSGPADSVISVSLLTAAPGSEVYELEGHSGLRFRTATSDYVANWGLFDFDSPNFVYRFVKGETDYCVALIPTPYFLSGYAREHRRVTEQILNLTQQQKQKLLALVTETVKPENRVYRYNYVLDNCATRPIAYLEKAIGDTIEFPVAAAELGEKMTFRSIMRHYHKAYLWYQFGIDLALGSGIDYPLTIRQSGFAPVVLEEIAAHATIADSIPLVDSTLTLVPGKAEGPILPPTPWYLTPLTAMWVLAALCTSGCLIALRREKLNKRWQSLYFAVMGLAGCLIWFLVCISTHEATSPNWIILWINPACLAVPILVWFKSCAKVLRWYMMANIFLLAVYAMTCAFGTQSPNSAFIPLALSDFIMSLSFIRLTRQNNP